METALDLRRSRKTRWFIALLAGGICAASPVAAKPWSSEVINADGRIGARIEQVDETGVFRIALECTYPDHWALFIEPVDNALAGSVDVSLDAGFGVVDVVSFAFDNGRIAGYRDSQPSQFNYMINAIRTPRTNLTVRFLDVTVVFPGEDASGAFDRYTTVCALGRE